MTESIETYLYRRCENKAKEIGTIEVLLKENAIDKYLFQNSNVIKDKDLKDIVIKPCLRSEDEFTINPYDKSYSRTCSFLEDCDYIKEKSFSVDLKEIKDSKFSIKNSQKQIC